MSNVPEPTVTNIDAELDEIRGRASTRRTRVAARLSWAFFCWSSFALVFFSGVYVGIAVTR